MISATQPPQDRLLDWFRIPENEAGEMVAEWPAISSHEPRRIRPPGVPPLDAVVSCGMTVAIFQRAAGPPSTFLLCGERGRVLRMFVIGPFRFRFVR